MRSDMFFTLEKLEERRKELEDYRYQEKQEIGIIRYLEADGKAVAPILPVSQKDWKTGSIDMNWSGRDSYLWLELTVDIPESFQNRRVVGLFDFGKTGSGNNSGFESLLYLDGKPYQGVDINHQEVFLPQSYVGCGRDWKVVDRQLFRIIRLERHRLLGWMNGQMTCFIYPA